MIICYEGGRLVLGLEVLGWPLGLVIARHGELVAAMRRSTSLVYYITYDFIFYNIF